MSSLLGFYAKIGPALQPVTYFPSFFILRPDRNDLGRLEAIIYQPEFEVQMQGLTFEVGNVETTKYLFRPKFLTLKNVKVTRRATKFKHEYFQQAWVGRNQGYRVEVAIQELWALLGALGEPEVLPSKFSHDQLPPMFFCMPHNYLQKLVTPLRNLAIMNLSLDALEAPSLTFWTGLSQFTRSCPKLEDLQLGFTSLIEHNSQAERFMVL
ncbi:hypothetical protein OCU04_012943 [Sclerotinia nivalis]|uniref:Uncharacterized protein n=1 Tax=Sclerotinia nivalis TaxID=352851 RepID=A0A9X0DCS8_9HELO|nr:hypothetical protein OCU04_012943 [Sclerotinia nivalis]